MSTRDVKVTVEIITHHTAPYTIDEADYLGWLAGVDDDPDRLAEYLRSGDDFEVIQSVYDGDPDGEIWSSVIDRVREGDSDE